MRMNLVLELLDVPGQLVKVLEPIGSLGANLVTVIHKRDYKTENGKVPVQLTLEGEFEDLKNVVKRFEDLGITITEMDDVVLKEKISTIFFGHIIDNDLRDTMDKILIHGADCVTLLLPLWRKAQVHARIRDED